MQYPEFDNLEENDITTSLSAMNDKSIMTHSHTTSFRWFLNTRLQSRDHFSTSDASLLCFNGSGICPIRSTAGARNAGESGVQVHPETNSTNLPIIIFMHNGSNLVKWMHKTHQPSPIHKHTPCLIKKLKAIFSITFLLYICLFFPILKKGENVLLL